MVSGYPTFTSIPRVDGLSTRLPVLGRHRSHGKKLSNQLHRHLHVAGNKKIPYIVIIIYSNAKYYKLVIFLLMTTYFLNPMFHYLKQFSHLPEIKIGLKKVMK